MARPPAGLQRGDHLAIGAKGSGEHGTGTGFVFEYDPATKTLRELVDVARLLKMPAGHSPAIGPFVNV